MTWIYILGEVHGHDVKIGRSVKPTIAERLKGVNNEQMTDDAYEVLAGVVGDPKDESYLKDYFEAFRRKDKGKRREYFQPAAEVVEYAAWLRAQYFATPDGKDLEEGWEHVPPEVWYPEPSRRVAPPLRDELVLVQPWETQIGPLANTPWSWFPDPKATFQDYFTPVEIVEAAREGMGGIDLDAASHWAANKKLRIPTYFTPSNSAFDNDWFGKVWLNPPYGYNQKWWPRAAKFVVSGAIEQMCILSPVWAFTTKSARVELMPLAKAMIVLVPTPKFWGNADEKTGSNMPHAIVYFGERRDAVLRALHDFGIPMEFRWDLLEQFGGPQGEDE